ncbi:MAG: hypothetical protein K0Q50_205 [Vampirovibrio sp.]|nr:hypothetical protein [Vampirovibrio sp.]
MSKVVPINTRVNHPDFVEEVKARMLPGLEPLTINKGQQQMILEYIEGKLERFRFNQEVTEVLSNIHTMVAFMPQLGGR